MSSISLVYKPRNVTAHPPARTPRLLDQLRERLCYLHDSLRTEQTYLYWTR